MKPRLSARVLLFILCTLSLTGCMSPPVHEVPIETDTNELPDQALRDFLDTNPRGDKLVFLGVAGIRSRSQESINLALEEAARRIAIYKEVEGSFSTRVALGGRLFDYRADSSSSIYYDAAYRDNLNTIEFDESSDVFITENTVFVRVWYPGSLGITYTPSRPGPGTKPYWIDNPPATIDGYTVGIGYAGRRDAHKDTIIISYENAILSVIGNISSVTWGQSIDYRGDGLLDYSASSRHGSEARDVLTGFYALEIWVDPSDRSVWTLAIAKEKAY